MLKILLDFRLITVRQPLSSTSGMMCGGLNQWALIARPGCFMCTAVRVIGKLELLLARTHSVETCVRFLRTIPA